MDLVFINKSPVHTSLVTPTGNIYYNISTEQTSAHPSLITRVEATRRLLPLEPVSRREFKRLPKGKDDVAKISWKDGASSPAYLHCKVLEEVVPAEKFMKKRHALKL